MKISARKYALSRKWFREHPEERRRYTKRYREKNAAILVGKLRTWRAENPGYMREWRQRIKFKRAWLSWTRTMAANRLKLSGGRRRDRSLRSLL
jgi:hypothetical protein